MSSSDSPVKQFYLRIERGRTKQPERPIDEERFLIGAGSNCHLQLGGEIPIVHSVIVQTSNGLWIDALMKEPQLLINRQPERECELSSGDVIEIGDFVFVVQQRTCDMDLESQESFEEEDVNLRDLTAEDIVDLLAAEIREIEELEAARQEGAQALLEAAANSDQQNRITRTELELIKFEEKLQERALELDQREATLAEKTDHLQRAQDRLAKYLQQFATQGPGSTGDQDDALRKRA